MQRDSFFANGSGTSKAVQNQLTLPTNNNSTLIYQNNFGFAVVKILMLF